MTFHLATTATLLASVGNAFIENLDIPKLKLHTDKRYIKALEQICQRKEALSAFLFQALLEYEYFRLLRYDGEECAAVSDRDACIVRAAHGASLAEAGCTAPFNQADGGLICKDGDNNTAAKAAFAAYKRVVSKETRDIGCRPQRDVIRVIKKIIAIN